MLRIWVFLGLFVGFVNLGRAKDLPIAQLTDTLKMKQELKKSVKKSVRAKVQQFFVRFRKFFRGTRHKKSSNNQVVIPGANRMAMYLPLLKDKRVAILANQTSVVNRADGIIHLVDTLVALGVQIVKVFVPEHGFRGLGDAGEKIRDAIDTVTGIPLISLYGKKQKPSSEDLAGVDIVIYDIQDVGVRFYTYISTFQLLMERCLEEDVPLVVLDRPNPNGFYVDGPILETKYKSLVGMQPIPVVYGMTIGEYARMLYNEGWLKLPANNRRAHHNQPQKQQFNLYIIPCIGYTHASRYILPIPPSPNLPNMQAVYLYPSLCFFEGTNVSVGRGTFQPFQCYGNPYFPDSLYSFIPLSVLGAKKPPYLAKRCYGYDLQNIDLQALNNAIDNPHSLFTLQFLLQAYHISQSESLRFFQHKKHFDKLAGSNKLYQAVVAGKQEQEIRQSWSSGLDSFRKLRKKYLLYKDFE